MKSEIVSKDAFSIWFRATSDREITENDAVDAMLSLGYHPAGYGLYRFNARRKENGEYVATWQCQRSCD